MSRPSARYQPPGCDCGPCSRRRDGGVILGFGHCERLPDPPRMVPHEPHCVEKLWGAYEYEAWGKPVGVSIRDCKSVREHCACGAYDE